MPSLSIGTSGQVPEQADTWSVVEIDEHDRVRGRVGGVDLVVDDVDAVQRGCAADDVTKGSHPHPGSPTAAGGGSRGTTEHALTTSSPLRAASNPVAVFVVVVDGQQRRWTSRAHVSLRRISAPSPAGAGCWSRGTSRRGGFANLGVPLICRTPSTMPTMPWMYPSDGGLLGALTRCPPSSSMAPLAHQGAPLALGAEAEVLELQQHGDREAVVRSGSLSMSAGPSPAR